MRARVREKRTTRFWGRAAVYSATAILIGFAFPVSAKAQLPEQSPPEENPEAEVEPTPIPGTEVLLTPELPPSEKPLPGRTINLGPPGVVEPILPPVNFEALGRSGRLWSFHGVVKEFRISGNHAFSNGTLLKVLEKY